VSRSALREIRNPLLALPAFQELRDLPNDSRAKLRVALIALSRDANDRAEKSWKQKKGPMAVYWKAVGVYAKHTARCLAQ
jgi:phage-related protein